jgi:hypothetical protein
LAFSEISSVRPKSSAFVGQAWTQNGCLSSLMRSLHIVHLVALPVMSFLVMTSHGQAWMQYSQPMQTSLLMTTGPSSYFVIASTGHTAAQAAKVQCMQLLRAQIGASPSSTGGSMVIQLVGDSS